MKIESYQPSFSGGVLRKGDKSLFHLLPGIDKLDPGITAIIKCRRVSGVHDPNRVNTIIKVTTYSEKPIPKFLNFLNRLKIIPSHTKVMLGTQRFRVNSVDPADVNKNADAIRNNLNRYRKSF
ncbi:MAG: hypothetical protein LBK53_02100 [Heliobacteriaceae bacterium]|jgi:hypothetical protein|nr:hypothetical protein [Heliobacteriaceae bacterium]